MIFVLLYIVMLLFFLMILKGSNINKTKEEIFFEKEEQMNIIAEYEEKRVKIARKRNEKINNILNSIRNTIRFSIRNSNRNEEVR